MKRNITGIVTNVLVFFSVVVFFASMFLGNVIEVESSEYTLLELVDGANVLASVYLGDFIVVLSLLFFAGAALILTSNKRGLGFALYISAILVIGVLSVQGYLTIVPKASREACKATIGGYLVLATYAIALISLLCSALGKKEEREF